jgi:hypothetical protein
MKIAHIIMTHKNPAQLERLIQRLQHPMSDIYIHLDKKVNIGPFKYLEQNENVFFINNRVECNWGGYSFVRAIMSSLKEVLKGDNYEFINLMSAQDYPIKHIEDFYQFLLKHRGMCFISYEHADKRWWQHAVARYRYYHFTDLKLRGKYLLQKLVNKLMPRRNFPLDISMYGSSNSSWWVISAKAAEYVVSFIESNSKLKRFMRFTWGSDEFLIATVLMNSPFKNCVINNNLRYIDWSEGGANPKIFSKKDLYQLMKSDHFFARKFDMDFDSEILNMIDRAIIKSNKVNSTYDSEAHRRGFVA